jgi:hypothetical protein
MYPRPLYSHVLEGVTKNWAAFREDPLTEARAWSRHVSHMYPCPLYSHLLEGVTKNWAAFREDPLTEARAWSRHVSL